MSSLLRPWLSRSVFSLVLSASGGILTAQQPSAAQRPAFKGIWEPVSFTEDISLREVFFVTVDKGWAAGDKGTIIKTTDGGATWTAQVGGDPQAKEDPVKLLTFLDEAHGWAIRDDRVLRTEDGESWEDLGAAPQYAHALAMSSLTEGVAAGYLGMGRNPSTLLKTRDGGKTWKPVVQCAVKAQVGGLTKEFGCEVIRIQFVSPSVGYLVARYQCAGMGCAPPPILGKTEDAGDSWRFFVGPGNPDEVGATDLFFTDENTGVVSTTDGKLSRTTDGGQTWKGLLASVSGYASGGLLGFADPEVGWALYGEKLSFTTDGGAHWNSRAVRFPASPAAWSFPRRDRAYVVGDHGMVFRYRVAPDAEPVKPGVLLAPAMPVFASPLEKQVAEVQGTITEVAAAVDRGAESGAASAPAPSATPDEGATSPFIAKCCGTSVNKLGVLLGAVLQSLPQFVTKFKNTNLLLAGLRMISTLPAQLGELRNALKAFRSATDKDSAKAALAQAGTAASALAKSTKEAFQK